MLKLHDHMGRVLPASRIEYDRRRIPLTMTSTETSCSVCHEALTATTEAVCNSCGAYFHLNQRNDLPGKDCGEVWINEEHMALEFACNTCLHPEPAPDESLDDVLDLVEAAAATGMSEEALTAAAERGELRHRKTAGGIYLFARRDLLALTGAGR